MAFQMTTADWEVEVTASDPNELLIDLGGFGNSVFGLNREQAKDLANTLLHFHETGEVKADLDWLN